jgi:hypothetical protein
LKKNVPANRHHRGANRENGGNRGEWPAFLKKQKENDELA